MILEAILVWALVSLHIVGGAFLFRRLFPRESVWLGFLVPSIVVVLVCNFLEHHVALSVLPSLLPVTTMASIASIAAPKIPWRVMRLPTFLFLGVFAFTLFLRMMRPNLTDSRDGVPDVGLIANFLFGQKLPVESTWLPPVKMLHYYYLEQYGASVLIRLMGIDIGTGFNVCAALLSAFTFFLIGGVAWLLSRGKIRIVLMMLVLTACATTGDAGYLWLTVKNMDQEAVINPNLLLGDPALHGNWFLSHLSRVAYWDAHELMPPAYGAWMGCLHSAQTGQLFICLAILSLIELLRRRRTNWPWITLAIMPVLTVVTCTWVVLMLVFLIAAAVLLSWKRNTVPQNWAMVVMLSIGLSTLLEPMLTYFFVWNPPASFAWVTKLHTQPAEFFMQWWPVYLPGIALLFVWKRLHPVTRIVLLMTPIAFAAVEMINYGERVDATAKTWGAIYAAAWITFLPEIAQQRAWPFRVILGLVVMGSVLSFCFWSTFFWRMTSADDFAQLDGRGRLRTDPAKARILEICSHLDNQVIIPGKPAWAYSESALLPLLCHNRAYVAWTHICDTILYTNGNLEADRRGIEVGQLYAGKNADPLMYLRQRNIAALVIYPDDNMDPAIVEQLKQKLGPYYTYEDATDRTKEEILKGVSLQRPCAGVFLYHPEITTFLRSVQDEGGKLVPPAPK